MSILGNKVTFEGAEFVVAYRGTLPVILAKRGLGVLDEVAVCPSRAVARGLRDVIYGTPVAGAPVLYGAIPATIAGDAWTKGGQNIMVEGANFHDYATITLAGLGLTFMNRATVGYANDILWTAWTSGNITPGSYDAVYSDPEGNSVTLSGALTVT